jgi:pyruvate kinase
MILISNHLLRTDAIEISKDAVIRINIAWVKDEDELRKYIDIPYAVFVDYPDRRKKPPLPPMSFEKAIEIVKDYKNVKFFAISNAETYDAMSQIRDQLSYDICLVPKIETVKGVANIDEIVEGAQTTYIMLDKEDLYLEAGSKDKYLKAISDLRESCIILGVKIFELTGVIFSDDM